MYNTYLRLFYSIEQIWECTVIPSMARLTYWGSLGQRLSAGSPLPLDHPTLCAPCSFQASYLAPCLLLGNFFWAFSHLKVQTKYLILFWFHIAILREHKRTIHDIPSTCRHHLCELRLPILDIGLFVDGLSCTLSSSWKINWKCQSFFQLSLYKVVGSIVNQTFGLLLSPCITAAHFVWLHCFSFYPGRTIPCQNFLQLVRTIQRNVFTLETNKTNGSIWSRQRPPLYFKTRFGCLVRIVIRGEASHL